MMIWTRFKRRDDKINVPTYAHAGDSGLDLQAAFDDNCSSKWIYPGQILLVPTGLSFDIPYGFEGQVRPRSGLACKHGITVVNSPGTIDSNYRGEIKVGLINLSPNRFKIIEGDRIAQLVICPVGYATLKEVNDVEYHSNATTRGINGFGSTGV